MEEQTGEQRARPLREEQPDAPLASDPYGHAHQGRGDPGASPGKDSPADRTPGGVNITPAPERMTLQRQDAGNVNAVHLSMDRSGAETIDAQRLTMTSSGAKTLSTQSAQLDKSGVVLLKADRAVFQDSSSIVTQSREARFVRSRVGIAQTGSSVIEPGVKIGILQSGTVTASGDINTVVLFGGGVAAEGKVSTMLDARSAAALGGGFAVVWLLLRRILSR